MKDNTVLGASAVAEVERIVKEGSTSIIEVDGREYTTRPVHDPRKPEPEPEPIGLSTLQSFAEYVGSELDDAYAASIDAVRFVHVEGPDRVRYVTDLYGEFHQRTELAVAEAIVPEFNFGLFQPPEMFNIGLLSAFEPSPDREKVFAITGNMTTEAAQTVEDDGISQRATLRAGVIRRGQAEVPQTVVLTPYRSFGEIEQVPSAFVLRLRGGGEGKPPSCALFECDGGRWRLEAINRVKKWLAGEIGDGFAVYG